MSWRYPLVIQSFGAFLGKKGRRFVVRLADGTRKEVSADHVKYVVLEGVGMTVSVDAIKLAVKERVPIFFATGDGKPIAAVFPMMGTGTVITRREQYAAYEDYRSVELAKAFVMGKLENQAKMLKYFSYTKQRLGKSEESSTLRETSEKIKEIIAQVDGIRAKKIEEVRGTLQALEAKGGELYWKAFGLLVKGVEFPGRVKRGANDPVNCLLNYGYGMLKREVLTAVYYSGLDPFAGFLHADRPGRISLVFDLMEEFRQFVVDRVVLKVINLGILKPDEVLTSPPLGYGKLTEKAKKVMVEQIDEQLRRRVYHKGKRMRITTIIKRQVEDVKRYLLKKIPRYEPFSPVWT